MRALLTIILFAVPLIAQTQAELQSKFGPPEGDRYRIKSNMVVQATFFKSGRVKTLRIIPDDPTDKKALLTNEEAWKTKGQLVPGRFCHRPQNLSQLEASSAVG